MKIEKLLSAAAKKQATDLHITAHAPPMIRVGGRLCALGDEDLKPTDTDMLADGFLNDERRAEFDRAGQVSFSHGISGLGRFRVVVYRQRGSTALSIRLVYPGTPTVESLALPEVVQGLALDGRGLVIVTGPLGSSKTMVLAALIDHINQSRSYHVVSLENPVEYLHKHSKSIVNQREIGTDVSGFPDALATVRWQDPDVVVLGDIPDLLTLRMCLDTAQSACLVLAAVRANGVEAALRHLVSLYPPEERGFAAESLSDCLRGVVGLMRVRSDRRATSLLLTEVMLATEAVKQILREQRFQHIDAAIKTGHKSGMLTFERSLEELARTGKIDEDDMSAILQNGKITE